MPKFESHGAGVTVKDDNGRILGVAYPYGQALSADSALAQVGYVADEEAEGGVRRVHDGLIVPSTAGVHKSGLTAAQGGS